MKRIIQEHLELLRRARDEPEELVSLRDHLFAQLYPPHEAPIRPVRQERIPADAPDWYFEAELRRSGLWDMMERCYPTPLAQAQ